MLRSFSLHFYLFYFYFFYQPTGIELLKPGGQLVGLAVLLVTPAYIEIVLHICHAVLMFEIKTTTTILSLLCNER